MAWSPPALQVRVCCTSPSALYAAAPAAQREALARHVLARERRRRLPLVQTAEVDLPERGGGHVFEAEGLPGIWRSERAGYRCGIEVRRHLPRVEERLAVISLVHDTADPVGRRGMNEPQPEHLPFLPRVSPQGVAAPGTRAVSVAGVDVLAVGAGRAQTPPLDRRHPGVDTPNFNPAATGVERIFRRELAQRRSCGANVLIDDGVVLRFAVLALAPLEDDRVQRNARFRNA